MLVRALFRVSYRDGLSIDEDAGLIHNTNTREKTTTFVLTSPGLSASKHQNLHQIVDDIMCRDFMQRFTCRHDNLVWVKTTVFPCRDAVGERRRLRGRTIFCPRQERRRTMVRLVDPQARCRGRAPLRVLGSTDLNILHNRRDNIFGPQDWSYTWRERTSRQQRGSRRRL